MRKYIISIVCLSLVILLSACEKDNYKEPKSTLTGRVYFTQNGENKSLGVKGTDDEVRMQLYQDGYGRKNVPIDVFVNQDGSFSAVLFDGTYKMVTRDNNGPWINTRDTTVFEIKGDKRVEYLVKPYYVLKNETVTLAGNTVTAKFDLEQLNANSGIDEVILYINNTKYVDNSYQKAALKVAAPILGSNTVTFDVSGNTQLLAYPILYTRIGVRIKDVSQRLFTSEPIKIK